MPAYTQGSAVNPLISLSKGNIGFSWGALGSPAIAASPNGLNRSVINGIPTVTLTTSASHLFQVGQTVQIKNSVSVQGTLFDGLYTIASIVSATVATLISIEPTRLHQAVDNGGGGTATSIQYESPAILSLGAAFSLSGPETDNPYGFAVDGVFNGAPGAFEVDVQVAQEDGATNYQTISGGNITTVDATNNTFHLDAPTAGAKFVAIFLRARANNVGLIASIRR